MTKKIRVSPSNRWSLKFLQVYAIFLTHKLNIILHFIKWIIYSKITQNTTILKQ